MQEEMAVFPYHDWNLFTMESIKFSNQYSVVTCFDALHF